MDAPDRRSVSVERALELLANGDLRLEQQIAWSSNATFLARVSDPELTVHAVYKPQRGERPLWDFPPGTLCLRETAAFLVSEALGWRLVPPTVLREGPLGFGALQVFVEHDPDAHYLALESPDKDTVQRIAALDVVVNNADRKSGHVLLDPQGELWAIDHGVCFHVEPKLRTVIWEFAGQALPDDLAGDIEGLLARVTDPTGPTRTALSELLAATEIDALIGRSRRFSSASVFPSADPGRRAIPWPPV